ncbi:ATP-binding cassette sub-family C member 4 [Nematostella vectensis]|uniref:ATP-binding cassette sub-family C member 4 n=1 Tax=Nematostella vectensis TaxID=45351 RepID=UPI0020778CD5|nr:ATP-binding cassette sub-family C member 4 [Nematostella vectensis]
MALDLGKETNPRLRANAFQWILFSWMNGILFKGFKRNLTAEDLYELPQEDQTTYNVNILEQEWNEEIRTAHRLGNYPRLYKSVLRALPGKVICKVLTFQFLRGLSTLSYTVLLWFFLRELGLGKSQLALSLMVVGFTVVSISRAISRNQMELFGLYAGMRLKVALIGLIYKKILNSSRCSLSTVRTGYVINLISNDAKRIELFISNFSMAILGPFKIVVCIVMLCLFVGWQSLSGALFLFIIMLYGQLAAKQFAKLRGKAAAVTDRRLGAVSEVIHGIRAVKMYAWEWNYSDEIKGLRREEMRIIRLKNLILSTFVALYSVSASIAALISIITLIFSGIHLDPARIFTMINLLKSLEFAIVVDLAECLREVLDAFVSIRRIEQFLLGASSEINRISCEGETTILSKTLTKRWIRRLKSFRGLTKVLRVESFRHNRPILYSVESITRCTADRSGDDTHHLTVQGVAAGWQDDSCTLQGVSFAAGAGDLVIITGPVGSGKSTLLMTIQGELPLNAGSIRRHGHLAYVSQVPWVFSGTVRENITFGKEYDKAAYEKAIRVCDLAKDINRFPKGDLSCIGQRGVSLSGGQRTRVSLARAVYADADIYLLDDPLSAVDAKVGSHLFKECICGALTNKVRILVTHQLQYLKHADSIIVLSDGKIAQKGTFQDMDVSHVGIGVSKDSVIVSAAPVEGQQGHHDLIDGAPAVDMADEEEDQAVGSVRLSLYWKYFRAGLSAVVLLLIFIFCVFTEASILAPMWWLSYLSEMTPEKQASGSVLGVYAGLVGLSLLTATGMASLLFIAALRSSENLHNAMTTTILKSPILFFDTNPFGRIMNRFSKDIGTMDDHIPLKFSWTVTLLFHFMGVLLFSAIVEYRLVLSAIPVFVVFLLICWFYLRSSRELQRLEAVRCSPVYSHFTDTLTGLEVIRSSRMEKRFWEQLVRHQDEQTMALSLVISARRWMDNNLDLVCFLFVSAVAATAAIIQQDPASTGMLLSLAIAMAQGTSYGVEKASEVENEMTSVERVISYTRLPSEPGYSRQTLPCEDWPERGAVTFRDMSLVYREGTPSALDDITLEITAKQRVGIAGRTGAGKSSLLAALFRLPEPGGEVLIDGVDLGTIDIQAARRAMAVITQDPVLFGGTLRRNLDPFDKFTDQEIWAALESVQLLNTVRALPDQLMYQLGESGSTFSVGERQLLCLARALLQRCKVLVLDEATANVDYRTDRQVQQLIRSRFTGCTVLTIAHRLNTIMDYDKVIVLDKGHVVEYDTPEMLAGKQDGVFAGLLKNSHFHSINS